MSNIVNPYRHHIPSPVLWLDANDIDTLYQDTLKSTAVTTDGQTIGCWADKSGNGYDFVQASSSIRPTYKTNIMNSLPVIRGDGADWLTNTNSSNWVFLHDGSPRAIFIVYEVAANNESQYFVFGNCDADINDVGMTIYLDDRSVHSLSEIAHMHIGNGLGVGAVIYHRTDNGDFPAGSPSLLTNTYQYGLAGDDSNFYYNGENVSTKDTVQTPASGTSTEDLQLFAGGTSYAPIAGDISEVRIYEYLERWQFNTIVEELMTKWGIT